jgi:hypothetical protein
MIECKPKVQAQFALWVFVLACLVIGILLIVNFNGENWKLFIASIMLPIGLFIGVRNFWSYKFIYFGKNKVEVRFPFRFKKIEFNIKDLSAWKEENVKTAGTYFQEITIRHQKDKISFSNQEFSNYEKAKNYLVRKTPKKQSGKV